MRRRAQRAHVLALLIVAAGCGSTKDLLIGRDTSAVQPSAGAGGVLDSGGGVGASAGIMIAIGGIGAGIDTPEVGGTAGALLGSAGEPNAGATGALSCDPSDVAPTGSLVHRYAFDGSGSTGTLIKDLVGSADGTIAESPPPPPPDAPCPVEPRPALNGAGQLVLDGCKGYVNLPNNLLKSLTDVSIVTWQTWSGGAAFERYFDFGKGVAEDDTTGQGSSYLAVATYGLNNTKLQLLTREGSSFPEESIRSFADMNDKMEHQVAAVFVSNSHAELFRDGSSLGTVPISWSLSSIEDVNEWIGRSQWASDHTFKGEVDEFRIYNQALTPCAIAALYAAGPDG